MVAAAALRAIEESAIKPFDELAAFERLYDWIGTSRGKVSKFFEPHGSLPSQVYRSEIGMFDDEKYHEIKEYLTKYLGSFSVLIDGSPQFPSALYDAANFLPILYYLGNLSLLELRRVSIVGTRKPSTEGIKRARLISRKLTEAGIVVLSGLASGIDTAALNEATSSGGNVIGVIGTPMTDVYPFENKSLQEIIAAEHLLVSQVPVFRYDHQPFRTRSYYFPERNVTMAALSEATIIVEASETSGTRSQAKACIDQGRKLIILDNVFQQVAWADSFVEQGAIRAKDLSDIVEVLGIGL